MAHAHSHHRHEAAPRSAGASRTQQAGSTPPKPKAPSASTRLAARNTRQRDAVAQALHDANAPVSAKQILTLASKHAEGMGLATVYRTLKLLIEAGEAQAVDIPGLTPLFERTGKGHHHHFVCTACERVFELEGACCGHFDDLAPQGFITRAHELSLYGLCDRCAKTPDAKPEAKAETRPAPKRPKTKHTHAH
jgi:Fur family ferric uptake transcriptional regulator